MGALRRIPAAALLLLLPVSATAGCYVDQSDFVNWLCRSGRAYSSWCSAPRRSGNFASRDACESARRRAGGGGDRAYLNRSRCVCDGGSTGGRTRSSIPSGNFTTKQYVQMSMASLLAGLIGNAIGQAISSALTPKDSPGNAGGVVRPVDPAAEAELQRKIAAQVREMEQGYVELRRAEFEEGKKDLLSKLEQRFADLDGGGKGRSLRDLYCSYYWSMEAAKAGNLEEARRYSALSASAAPGPGGVCPEPSIPLPDETGMQREEFRREMLETALQEIDTRVAAMKEVASQREAARERAARQKEEVERHRKEKETVPAGTNDPSGDDLLAKAEEALHRSEEEVRTAEEEYRRMEAEVRAIEKITQGALAGGREEKSS